MSNSLNSVFSFKSTAVRTIADDRGEPWFSATDVCAILGYRNPWDATAKHCREGGLAKREVIDELGRQQEMTFINEGNLYRLIVKSRKPEAEAFEQWVMEEVLPAIRKTGRYEAQPYAVNPGDTLTKEQADTLRNMISDAAEKLPQGKRGEFIRTGWSKLKSHFKTNYRQIPAAEFTEAVSIVSRHIIANAKQDRTAISHIEKMKIAEAYVKNARFVMSFDSKGMMQLHEVPESAVLLTPDEIVRHIAEPGTFPVSLLPSVIQAAGKRIQSAMPALIGA